MHVDQINLLLLGFSEQTIGPTDRIKVKIKKAIKWEWLQAILIVWFPCQRDQDTVHFCLK